MTTADTRKVYVLGQRIELTTRDYKGRKYTDYYVRNGSGVPCGPGWFIFGRNNDASASITMLCAQPDTKPRQYKFWNGKYRKGWALKRQAQAIADYLNREGTL